jgi:hypothetical protein
MSGVPLFECKHVRECVKFSTNIIFVQHVTMSHRSDSSPKGKVDNSFFVLQAMQQQFERLNLVLGEVRDRMDH